MSTDEFNRLTKLGMDAATALRVLDGKVDKKFAVSQARERKRSRNWFDKLEDIPATLNVQWDRDPKRFHLVFNDVPPGDVNSDEYCIIEGNAGKIEPLLTPESQIDHDPWHEDYTTQSAEIAYRWAHDRAVTPPLIEQRNDRIHIVAGVVRFHLALHYGTTKMSFLVRKSQKAQLLKAQIDRM